MRTEAWIEFLAQGAGAAPRGRVWRRILPGMGAGLLASILLAEQTLGWIPAALFGEPAPWFKLAYGLSLAIASVILVNQLARPVPRAAPGMWVATSVVAMALLIGAGDALLVSHPDRLALLWGHSWAVCSVSVLGLSIPALCLTLWAIRGLAPTRLGAAGAAAGLLAGSLGAIGYALACTERALPFVAVWYTLGILLTAGLGAVLGPRWLRW